MSLDTYYEIKGDGKPVLYISGTGGDLRMKPSVLDGPLSKVRHVIAYDQRGLGQSEKPEAPYTMEDYADDAANLASALNHEKLDVVGVSFGGMVALQLVLRHPDLVDNLVLCCTSPGGAMPSYPFHDLPADITPEDRAIELMAVNDLRRTKEWQQKNPAEVQKIIDYVSANKIADHDTDEYHASARAQIMARSGHDVLDQLTDITHRTLICGGRYDGIAPVQNQEKMNEMIPNSSLQWFEGGHLFMLQDRSAWPAIINFLN